MVSLLLFLAIISFQHLAEMKLSPFIIAFYKISKYRSFNKLKPMLS